MNQEPKTESTLSISTESSESTESRTKFTRLTKIFVIEEFRCHKAVQGYPYTTIVKCWKIKVTESTESRLIQLNQQFVTETTLSLTESTESRIPIYTMWHYDNRDCPGKKFPNNGTEEPQKAEPIGHFILALCDLSFCATSSLHMLLMF